MILHCGAREVTRDQLELVPCPSPSGRWRPVPHHQVLDHAVKALGDAGYGIQKMKLGLARDDQRFWGTLVLDSRIVPGVSLSCAVSSSIDQSTSLRWGYGHNVMVCDNGAWRVERTISKKHTTFAVDRYFEAICQCVADLPQFRAQEATRIEAMERREISDMEAESILLRCYEEQILSPRTLPTAIREWRDPSFVEYEARNAWSIFNAITHALNGRAKTNPQAHAAATIKLGGILTAMEPQHANAV